MAKGKGKGKGKKGDKKKKAEIDPNLLTEVDKTFYELQITDLNRKLARLRTLTKELEEKNEELKETNKKLEEDHGDVIIYLKKMLQEKADEMAEVQERLKATQETRNEETEQFQKKIEDMEQEYKQMHEQLTSEIKLLAGKLNSLEEFRIQRDELMRKFDSQGKAMREQDMRHKRELYDVERKFIIGKDKLKKEMEARLLQLSTEFQDATEVRIAATTHRVIRENIAINNELEVMLQSQHELLKNNDGLKSRDRNLRLKAELCEDETKQTLYKCKVQQTVIEKLTEEHDKLLRSLNKYQSQERDINRLNHEVSVLQRDKDNAQYNSRVLEQNLHHSRCERTGLETELLYLRDETVRLSDILYQAVMVIQEALELKLNIAQGVEVDEGEALATRSDLLQALLGIMSKATEERPRKPSLDSVDSMAATYKRGDLGFVPKPVELRSKLPTRTTKATQIDESFDEYIKELLAQQEEKVDDKDLQMALLSDPNLLRDYLRELEMDESLQEEASVVSVTLFEGMDEASADSSDVANVLDDDDVTPRSVERIVDDEETTAASGAETSEPQTDEPASSQEHV